MIKFRVYDLEKREMWATNDYEDLSELFMALDTDDSMFSNPMQSTGLFDNSTPKNEVFEGDIVEITYDIEPFIGVVVYDLGETDFKATNNREDYGNNFQYLTVGESIKVIGNVHQHSNLLESVEE